MSPRHRWPPVRVPPPWWPHNEPWPPLSGRFYREQRRRRFSRVSGWYSFFFVWALIWGAVRLAHMPGSIGGFPMSGGVTLLLICAAIAGGVAIVVRFISGPIADVVSAADRISNRDYKVRVKVPERGPAWVGDTARAFNSMASQLEAQDLARRHLMADIAHELRTPLAVVQGKIEGIIDGVYARDGAVLQELLDETRVLTRLVEDLRTLSTAESGAMALSKEPTDLLALANDVIASLAARAQEAGVSLRAEGRSIEDADPVTIDPVRIREVLTNLTANALRYTPRGGRVTIALESRADGVEIRVVDTGAGISADDLPRIFDRFYKGAGSSGSGLGLTIARSLVEAHGGTLRAESAPGKGTTMIVGLPR